LGPARVLDAPLPQPQRRHVRPRDGGQDGPGALLLGHRPDPADGARADLHRHHRAVHQALPVHRRRAGVDHGTRDLRVPELAVPGDGRRHSVSEALDGGEALIRAAGDLGADYIFASAGSEWAPVWEAFARRAEQGTEGGPRYLDLTHETTAVGMATGYAAVTGRPQVVLLHAVAGLLQGANAIHGALLTGAPVVVCSGESTGYGDGAGPDPGSQWYRNLSVVGGPQAVAAPFTKWASAAADASVLYGMIKRAGELAAQAPAGPVYVNTPVEVLLAPWKPAGVSPAPAARANATVAVGEDVALAVRLLALARRPVLAVETAGRDPEAFAALVELAELL